MKTRFILSVLSMLVISTISMQISCSDDKEPSEPDCTTLDVTVPSANIVEPTDCASNNGQITAVASGGEEPYQYKIGSGTYQASAVFSNLSAGTYLITVKDKNNCEATSSNIVVDNPSSTLAAETATEQNTECVGGNGSITVTASGGADPYQYKIGSGAFGDNAAFSNLEAGTYSITVKDSDGCTVTLNASVTQGDTDVTYDADIKPLLLLKCNFAGCHPDNGNWFDYATAKSKASTIKTKTGNKSMPKGGAAAPGGALSDDQIKLIACWVDAGAPQN